MKTSEVLNRAADLIEERGWTRRTPGWGGDAEQTGLCLEGGIIAALDTPLSWGAPGLSFYSCPAYQAVHNYLALQPWPAAYVYDFNDAEGRTATEVIEVLRACAVIEAAREDQDAAEATYAENLAVSV